MEEQIYSVGPLMKAARKFKKFNQSDVAQAIGCSQSALSKMEHNLLVPSAPQWFLFARFTSIPPESLESGFINRHSKVKFNNDQVSLGYKIPKRYRQFRSQKVCEIYPFFKYLAENMTKPTDDEFISSTGIDKEFFLDFDNLVNFQFLCDVIDFFIKKGLKSEGDIKGIVNFGQDDIYWDNYAVEWKEFDTIADVLNEYTHEQVFFQADFQLKVEIQPGKILMSYYPEYHLKQISTVLSDEVVRFINIYRQATLENLILRSLNTKARVTLIPDVSASPLAARFEIVSL